MPNRLKIIEFEQCSQFHNLLRYAEGLTDLYDGSSKVIKAGNARYAQRGDTLYILGTDDLDDVAQSLDVGIGSEKALHRGARKHAELIEQGVDFRNVRLLVGHSLGGAAAQVLSAKYEIPCVTFGSFAIYDSKQEGGLLDYHCRVVHRGDPVPHLPPGFYHRETFRLKLGPSWFMCLLSTFFSLNWSLRARVTRFHVMPAYQDALWRVLGRL